MIRHVYLATLSDDLYDDTELLGRLLVLDSVSLATPRFLHDVLHRAAETADCPTAVKSAKSESFSAEPAATSGTPRSGIPHETVATIATDAAAADTAAVSRPLSMHFATGDGSALSLQRVDVWCDQRASGAHETCADVVLVAFARALLQLREHFGSGDVRNWQWGSLHMADLVHTFNDIPVRTCVCGCR